MDDFTIELLDDTELFVKSIDNINFFKCCVDKNEYGKVTDFSVYFEPTQLESDERVANDMISTVTSMFSYYDWFTLEDNPINSKWYKTSAIKSVKITK